MLRLIEVQAVGWFRWIAAVLAMLIGLEAASADQSRHGSLVIIGGYERYRNRELWEEIRELAGGEGATIAVFPTASNTPVKSAQKVVETFRKYGADAFVVPLALTGFDVDMTECASDAQWIEKVRSANGVFFIGGRQDRLVDALTTSDGEHTPMLDAIWDVYRRGGVVAGTSAGAAVMSHVMFRDAGSPLQIMQKGANFGHEIDRGLGFLDPDWIVDQHALVRGRFARTLVAMHAQNIKYGVGVDENTALVVRNGHDAYVVGHKGVLILELTEVEQNPQMKGFNLKNVKLTYLDRGDAINLKTLAVSPSAEKLDDQKLDPNAADFEPYYNHGMFYADILGNCTVADLLGRLIDNARDEAIGLAFDVVGALTQPVDGFEFRFYRGKDTVGWYTEEFGGEDYTVVNVRLDIRPIRISGPLYTHHEPQAETTGDLTGGE